MTSKLKPYIMLIIGSAILAFGLYNVHSVSNVTEGGALGLTLLFQHHFDISPAISGVILNAICYLIGFKALGKKFIIYSAVAAAGFSAFYAVFECFPVIYPEIADMPLLSAVIGALFVGVGVGLCVRAGGAPSGDDALAMSISKLTKLNIRWVYLISDVLVLGLSVSYIPLSRIAYSLITVIISGQIVGFIEKRHSKD